LSKSRRRREESWSKKEMLRFNLNNRGRIEVYLKDL